LASSRIPAFDAARGLNRQEAARYVGVSVTTFDKLVADGRMPRPMVLGARRIFDRFALDQYFEALDAPAESEKNDFDED